MADVSIRNATKRVNLTKRSIQGHAQGHTYTGGLESKKPRLYITLQWQLGIFSCHIAAEHSLKFVFLL